MTGGQHSAVGSSASAAKLDVWENDDEATSCPNLENPARFRAPALPVHDPSHIPDNGSRLAAWAVAGRIRRLRRS